MLIFKKIIAIIVGLVGFVAYLQRYSYEGLKDKATEKEKKALGIIEGIAILFPIILAAVIAIE